jgi:oligopeptide transport system substrate-binding protein
VAPEKSSLTHTLGGEPESLDPALSTGAWEFYVIPALFEGLTQYHPELPVPMAAMATHYSANADFTRFRFYLRGHPAPRGTRLPDTGDLPERITNGRKGAPANKPALWSDGSIVTAQDFVYSWRRVVNPATAAPLAYAFYYIRHAEEINTGKRDSRDLGITALDEFTLEIALRAPTPFFLPLIIQYLFAAVPRQAIESAGVQWTQPDHIVTNGPFTLQQWRRYDRITLLRNPRYYDAGLVALKELTFYPVANLTTTMGLYKSGVTSATGGTDVPANFLPTLDRKKDLRVQPAFGTVFSAISAHRRPFDNVLLRYVLNMATDKSAIAGFMRAGRSAAQSLVAPMTEYAPPADIRVSVDGRTYDVLSFDVEGARSLLSKAGFPEGAKLAFTYHYPVWGNFKEQAEILQQQWRRNLNIQVTLAGRENTVHWKMVLEADYTGAALFAFLPTYFDPSPFLDPFATSSTGNPSGWTDKMYAAMLAEANSTVDPVERFRKLAECERQLLRAMPFVPMYFESWAYLCKPYVRGFSNNAFDMRSFKYAWIDTAWNTRRR